jgi:hypothetical protein
LQGFYELSTFGIFICCQQYWKENRLIYFPINLNRRRKSRAL